MKRPPVPFLVFLGVFAGSFVLVTLLSRVPQASPAMPQSQAIAPPEIQEIQKLYLESEAARSTLLFNLAFGTLGALLGLRFAEKTRVKLDGAATFGACGLLLTSIYSSFLFQSGMSRILEGTLDEMYGPLLRTPITCQFWSFFIAVILLSFTLFRPLPRKAALLIITGVLCATAAEAAAPCIQDWGRDHSLELPLAAITDAEIALERLRQKGELEPERTAGCDYAYTVLDQVRFVAISKDGEATGSAGAASVAKVLHNLAAATAKPTFAHGKLVDELLDLLEIWRERSGLLDLQSALQQPLWVEIRDISKPKRFWQRYTRCLLRLPPGKYLVSALSGGQSVGSAVTIAIADGDRRSLVLGTTP